MIGSALYSKLTTTAGIAALCGTNIYPNYIRESDQLYPQVVYDVGEIVEEVSFAGNVGIASAKAKITAVAKTYLACDALAKAIVAAIDEAAGTWAGTQINGVWLEDVEEEIVHDPTTELILYFVKVVTFEVSYGN